MSRLALILSLTVIGGPALAQEIANPPVRLGRPMTSAEQIEMERDLAPVREAMRKAKERDAQREVEAYAQAKIEREAIDKMWAQEQEARRHAKEAQDAREADLSSRECMISRKDFESLPFGTSLFEVRNRFDCLGEMRSSMRLSGVGTLQIYEFHDPASDGVATLTFQGTRMYSKSQSGLR